MLSVHTYKNLIKKVLTCITHIPYILQTSGNYAKTKIHFTINCFISLKRQET